MNILKEIDQFLCKLNEQYPEGLNIFEHFKHLNSIVENHNAIGREVCETLTLDELIEPIPAIDTSRQFFRITPKGRAVLEDGGYESFIMNKKIPQTALNSFSKDELTTLAFLTKNKNTLKRVFWISAILLILTLIISTGVLCMVLAE